MKPYLHNTRIQWIDIAKGICIFLMVIGHTAIPNSISKWIWSFHMPFFFFISGYTFKINKYNSLILFIKRKSRTLLFPFVIFSFINIIFSHIILDKDLFFLTTDLLSKGWGGFALWFVPILFIAEILSYYILISTNLKLKIISLICTIGIGYYLDYYNLILPWSLSTVFIAVAYLIIGNLSKKIISKTFNYKTLIKVILIILCLAIGAFISQLYDQDLCSNSISPLLPVFAGSIIGILGIILISDILSASKKSRFLQSLGTNSFIIMALSQIILMGINKFIKGNLDNGFISIGIRHISMWLVLFIIIQIINKRASWILGK